MVDCTGLENRQRATVREFESHRLRQPNKKAAVKAAFLLAAFAWRLRNSGWQANGKRRLSN